MKLLKLLLLILLMNTVNGFCQNTEQEILLEANTYFENGDYFSAANAYSRLINDVKKAQIEIVYKYAQSLRLYNSYYESAHWFKYIINHDTALAYPDAFYWYALMEKQNGNYDIASYNFQKYLSFNKGDKLSEFATLELVSCSKAKWISRDTLPVIIEHLGLNINTPYSEFGAIQLSDTALYYSSYRRLVSEEEGSILPGVFNAKIFRAKMSVAGLSSAKEFDQIINDKKTNNANITFSSDKSKLFFTRCSSNGDKMSCDIWTSVKKKNKWSKPEKLTKRINSPGYTTTQPCYISGEEYDVLYFSSDRPNGYGGIDIWYSIVKDEKFGEPVNLGSNINTIGDEITPFFNISDSTLYFSSNCHSGIGGFDVFSSQGGLNQWKQPKNMGVPINSTANDIYFTVNEIDNDGYLTSNRTGSFFIKGETCCNDIYYYEWIKNSQLSLSQDTIRIDTTNIEQLIKNILPLTLYFHNDEPDPATTKTTTDKNYKITLANYFALKDIYSDEYSKGLNVDEVAKARKDIDDFFNDYVKKGFSDLELFAQWLLVDLERGNSVKITIKGYTSPLHTAEYNMKLAMRRISSLKNYIYDYRNGIFKQYLERRAPNGATLELHDAPIGKIEANALVSDNPNDIRNSVFSRAAALERRIQIVMYESEKTKSIHDSTPIIAFPVNEINFGNLENNETKQITIQFQNRGISPITVDSIVVSSPIFYSSFSNQTISSQSSAYITFLAKTKEGQRNGTFYADIYYNRRYSKRIKLTIN